MSYGETLSLKGRYQCARDKGIMGHDGQPPDCPQGMKAITKPHPLQGGKDNGARTACSTAGGDPMPETARMEFSLKHALWKLLETAGIISQDVETTVALFKGLFRFEVVQGWSGK